MEWRNLGPARSANAEHLVAGNLDGDGDDEIVGDFGSDGIWAWDGGGWVQLSSQNSELMIMAKIDGDAAEELIIDLGSLGLWMWNGGGWNQLTGVNPEYLIAANADGDIASELAIDFGPPWTLALERRDLGSADGGRSGIHGRW